MITTFAQLLQVLTQCPQLKAVNTVTFQAAVAAFSHYFHCSYRRQVGLKLHFTRLIGQSIMFVPGGSGYVAGWDRGEFVYSLAVNKYGNKASKRYYPLDL